MKKRTKKQDAERIKYLENIIVKGDKNELEDERNRILGKPVKLDSFDDIRL
jgi:hypothetical protein